ncbi:ABC transporter substrate-binding protein (plasmid) [Halostagnicola larsenii XH-48]|uniref:ABC transporter substrate-binding protein n=1 Tax=Halostagnicola larsenii XH-48 TaxID=797299 RepID=W0JS10_9EURY|nr:metal ABC transporter substrate-binding protein [Halostagnicola larsenii]AHG01491.1 ABC transporter substrate-binding protein [Halostagnicola larsenii XH-48]
MPQQTRRRFVEIGLGAAAIGAIGGCLSNPTGSDSEETVVQTSFFVVGDFADAIAGDAATAETLVPVGQHGHGWEPGPQIQGTVSESDLFVRVAEGFQPWADDLVETLEDDDADVQFITAGADVDHLEVGQGHDHGSDGHDHESTQSTTEDGHDHTVDDPHFWLDPARARTAVETIRDAFVAVDGANEDAYVENAEEYRARLEELDETFESTLTDASGDVVLVAGHNAYQYLGHRYEFEIETLTGLAPDSRPTPADIERAQEIIAEHDLEYVCADPLESQTAAEQLVEETDATDILPLTPIPGQTQEWADDGWGYVDIMEKINLETLTEVLDGR